MNTHYNSLILDYFGVDAKLRLQFRENYAL